MTFRTINPSEFHLLQPVLEAAIEAEEFLTPAKESSIAAQEAYVFGGKTVGEVWILEENGEVLGGYYQRPNHAGLGSHVANGGYVVAPYARGKGVGRRLGEHSIARATQKGYRAMQFNFVVSTNVIAIALWKELGFEIIGTVPDGYHRKQLEYVDAYIMYRSLR